MAKLSPVSSWPMKWLHHFLSGWRGLLWTLGLAVAALTPFLLSSFYSGEALAQLIAYWGVILQIFGFMLVIIGVERSLQYLGVPTMLRRLMEYLSGFWKVTQVRNADVRGVAFGSPSAVGRGRVWTELRSGASIHERIDHLDSKIRSIHDELDAIRDSTDRTVRDLTSRIDEVSKQSQLATDVVKRRYDKLLSGNSYMEFFGALFFSFGVIFSSASSGISSLIGG